MLAGLIGDGLGILLLGLGYIAMRHINGGKKWERWAMRGIILLMFLGGAALLLTGIGQWLTSAARWVLAFTGPAGAVVIGTLAFIFLLLEVVMGIWRSPGHKAAYSAVFLAFALTLPLAGAPAQFATSLQSSATAYAAQIGTSLGI